MIMAQDKYNVLHNGRDLFVDEVGYVPAAFGLLDHSGFLQNPERRNTTQYLRLFPRAHLRTAMCPTRPCSRPLQGHDTKQRSTTIP